MVNSCRLHRSGYSDTRGVKSRLCGMAASRSGQASRSSMVMDSSKRWWSERKSPVGVERDGVVDHGGGAAPPRAAPWRAGR
jgi:hypothetical protein